MDSFKPFSIMEKYNTVNFKLLLELWNKMFVYGNDIQRHDFMAKKRLANLKNRVNIYFTTNSYKFLMS